MTDKLTPEELDEIRARHVDDVGPFWDGPAIDQCWRDRAALLRHVEALEQEVEQLRDENRHLSHLVNISPETAKLSSPAIAIVAQHDADNRVKAVERKLARLTVCPEDENGRHRWDETGQCWCCEQRAHMLIYEATGE